MSGVCECCGATEDLREDAPVVCRDMGACLVREAERAELQRAVDARRLPEYGWAI